MADTPGEATSRDGEPVPSSNAVTTVHACAILLGRTGLLITGRSGSGKSTLAHRLIDLWQAQGRHAVWVADDRIRLSAMGGRVIARCPQAIAGQAEFAHLGLAAVHHTPAGQMDCLIRLSPQEGLERMPQPAHQPIAGLVASPPVLLPGLDVPERAASTAATLVAAWLRENDL